MCRKAQAFYLHNNPLYHFVISELGEIFSIIMSDGWQISYLMTLSCGDDEEQAGFKETGGWNRCGPAIKLTHHSQT
jgi:hypothetical protein